MEEVFNSLAKGNYEKIFELSENSSEENKLEIDLIKIWIYLDYYGDFNLVVNIIDEIAKNEYKSNKNDILFLVYKASKCLFILKNLKDAKSHIFNAKKVFDKLSSQDQENLKRFKIYFLIYEFTIAILEGDIENSITRGKETLDFCEQNTFRYNIDAFKIFVKNDLAVLYRNIGQFEKSIQLFTETYDYCTSIENTYGQIIMLRGLGSVQILIGELDLALDSLSKIYVLAELISNKKMKYEILYYLGQIHYHKNEINESLKLFEKYLENNNDDRIIFSSVPYVLFNLIKIYIEKRDLDKAQVYISKLKKVMNDNLGLDYVILFNLSEILLLKNSLRFKDKVLAQDMLKNIINITNIDVNLKLTALIYLCELQLQEVELLGDEILFKDVLELFSEIQKITLSLNFQPFIIESELLQSKLELIEGNINLSMSLLENAEKLASEKHLINYLKKISFQKNKLNSNLKTWEELAVSDASIKKKLELAQLNDYITEALKLKELRNI